MIARPTAEIRPSPRRRGVTILETIVLMTAVAAMLGLCVLILQLLLKLDAQSRARLDGAGALGRLARQFRQDVHAARRASLVDRPAPLAASLRIEPGTDAAIGYEIQGDGTVLRTETRKGAQVRHESYQIPHSGAIQLAVKHLGDRSFASLTVNRLISKNRTDPPRIYEVLALVGKNRDRVGGASRAAGATP